MNRTYPRTAEKTARALRRWCDANAVDHEFLPVNGAGHPMIRVRHKDQTRKMSFSATPSDKRRGSLNAVSQLKRALRDMGWKPRKQEYENMKMGKQNLSKFDSRSPTLGAASECKVTRLKPPSVSGVEIPLAYAGYKVGTRPSTAEQSAIIADRNHAMLAANMAGATYEEIHKALHSAGWGVSLNSVSPLITKQRRIEGLPDLRKHNRKPVKTATKPAPVPAPAFGEDSLIAEIARAIAPILARRLGDNKALKDKADKWDAIRDLIGQDAT